VPDNQYVPVSDRALCIFLACLSEGWSVSKASEKAGFSYATAYVHRRKNPEFSAAWDDAIEQGTDHLEDIATARATEGYQRPIYVGGRLVGHVTEYSDGLLQFMLRGRRREKYGGNGNSSTAALVLHNTGVDPQSERTVVIIPHNGREEIEFSDAGDSTAAGTSD
jgi:hypothetical protein